VVSQNDHSQNVQNDDPKLLEGSLHDIKMTHTFRLDVGKLKFEPEVSHVQGNENKDQRSEYHHIPAGKGGFRTRFSGVLDRPSGTAVFDPNSHTFIGVQQNGKIQYPGHKLDDQIGAEDIRIRVKSFSAVGNQQLEVSQQVHYQEQD
jgi:hypothetical protein